VGIVIYGCVFWHIVPYHLEHAICSPDLANTHQLSILWYCIPWVTVNKGYKYVGVSAQSGVFEDKKLPLDTLGLSHQTSVLFSHTYSPPISPKERIMAPGALVEESNPSSRATVYKNEDAPRSVFPDGIRTSGQHPPLYDVLRPYSDFPEEITGPTVWKAEEYINSPERWVHRFTEDEVDELGDAADRFLASGIPLTGISKVCRGRCVD
jgi:hypothetical protein